MTPADLENQALALLGWLLSNFGAPLVMSVFGVVAGSTEGMAIEDVTAFVADVLGVIRSRAQDAKIRSIIDAAYNAADASVDAIEAAKFGKG